MYDFICITVVLPVVVASAAAVTSYEKRPFAAYLGQLSYPVYIIHQPIIRLGAQFQTLTDGFIPWPITVCCTLFAAVGVAHIFYVCYDAPVRAYLGRKFSLN